VTWIFKSPMTYKKKWSGVKRRRALGEGGSRGYDVWGGGGGCGGLRRTLPGFWKLRKRLHDKRFALGRVAKTNCVPP